MESFTIINNNVDLSSISGTAFKLFFALNKYSFGKKNSCYVSQRTLGDVVGKSIRTIQRCLKQLIKANLITVQHRLGTTNFYYILNKIHLQAQTQKNKFTNYVKDKFKGCRASNERKYDVNELEKALLARDSEVLKE